MKTHGFTLIELLFTLVVVSGFFMVAAYAYSDNHNRQSSILIATYVVEVAERIRDFREGNPSVVITGDVVFTRGLMPDTLDYDATAQRVYLPGGGNIRFVALNPSLVGVASYNNTDGFMIVTTLPEKQCATFTNLIAKEFELIRANAVFVKTLSDEYDPDAATRRCTVGSSLKAIYGIAL